MPAVWTNGWYSRTDRGASERLARHIAEAFDDVDYVTLDDVDGVPSVELAFMEDRGILTPARILELGRKLKATVGEHALKFHQARSFDVTFLVMHDFLRDGHPFSDEQETDYGTPFDEFEKAWTR